MLLLLNTILLLLGTSWCVNDNPCTMYHLMDMYDGRRLSNYNISRNDSYICDSGHIVTGWWQKFLWKGNNYKMSEECVGMNKCGTYAPIWINGYHPLEYNKVHQARICAHFGSDCCKWSESANVTRCAGGHGGSFYIYQLTEPVGCSMGFCVEQSEENKHQGEMIWCDRCTDIMIDFPVRVNWLHTYRIRNKYYMICKYTEINENGVQNTQSMYYAPEFYTATTIRCPIPLQPEYGRFIVDLVYYSYIYNFTQNVMVIVYDSTIHTCDTNGVCQQQSDAHQWDDKDVETNNRAGKASEQPHTSVYEITEIRPSHTFPTWTSMASSDGVTFPKTVTSFVLSTYQPDSSSTPEFFGTFQAIRPSNVDDKSANYPQRTKDSISIK